MNKYIHIESDRQVENRVVESMIETTDERERISKQMKKKRHKIQDCLPMHEVANRG